MNTQTIALICAGLGVVFSGVYAVMGMSGLKVLREMRDRIGRP
jgi:hypothetical protein